jgi:hypothetical protein
VWVARRTVSQNVQQAGLPCAEKAIDHLRAALPAPLEFLHAHCIACAGAGALFTGEACDVAAVLRVPTGPPSLVGAHSLSDSSAKSVPRAPVRFICDAMIAGRSLVDVFPSFARADRLRLLGLPRHEQPYGPCGQPVNVEMSALATCGTIFV